MGIDEVEPPLLTSGMGVVFFLAVMLATGDAGGRIRDPLFPSSHQPRGLLLPSALCANLNHQAWRGEEGGRTQLNYDNNASQAAQHSLHWTVGWLQKFQLQHQLTLLWRKGVGGDCIYKSSTLERGYSRKGTVLMGILMHRFAPTALSSERTDTD